MKIHSIRTNFRANLILQHWLEKLPFVRDECIFISVSLCTGQSNFGQYKSSFSTEVNPVKKVWLYEDEGETTEMFIEPGDRIRFRVAEEIFEDSKPKMGGEIQDKVIPYKIIAAIDDDGLGPVSWWN